MARYRTRLLFISALLVSQRIAGAADYGWIRAANSDLWSDAANWSPAGIPGENDRVTSTEASLAGPQSIDLGGARRINMIVGDGFSGVYTFGNSGAGALEFVAAPSSNLIYMLTPAASFVFNNNIAVGASGEFFFNSTATGGRIVVHGNITSSAASRTTTLNLTGDNLTIADV